MRDKKQLEYVENFKTFGSIVTNYARCIRKIKFRITMIKTAFNKKKALLTSKPNLNIRNKRVKYYLKFF